MNGRAKEEHLEVLYNIVVGLIGIFAAGVKCTRSACNDIEFGTEPVPCDRFHRDS